MFTLLDPRSKKTKFSNGREMTWGGPHRPWEYPEPTPDASEAQI